jgi:hypothetical protein
MSYTLEDRIQRLEEVLDNWVTCMFRHTAKMEKLGEQLSEIQCEIIELRKLVEAKSE